MSDIFELSRNYWAIAPQNEAKPFHHALYFFILNFANSLRWKPTFGIPTAYTLGIMGTTSYKTYIKALEDLERFGLIRIVERAKNQHTSNVIALVDFTKATTEADTKATTNADSKQLPTHIQYNKTDNTKEKSKNKKTSVKVFTPPELSEVIEYVKQNNFLPDLARQFHAYYTEMGWKKKNKEPVENWKLTMQTWMTRPDNQQYKATSSRIQMFDPSKHF